MPGSDSDKGAKRGVSRRRFVQAAGASGVAFGLAGCAGGGGGGGGQTTTQAGDEDVTIQFASDTIYADNADELNSILHEAGMPERITVEFVAGSQVTDNRRSQYQQWLQAGRSEPDVLMMDSGWTIPFIARQQLSNLSEENAVPSSLVSEVEDNYFQASVNTAKGPEGGLYGVPLFPDFPVMQYNKSYLREAGYGDSDFETWATDPPMWQEFAQITKETLDATDAKYGYTFQANVYEGLSCCDFNEFMTSWGGAYFGNPEENLFGPVGDRPITVDEQQVVDSIKMVKSFIHGPDADDTLSDYAGPIAPEAVLQWTEEPSRKPFTNGDAIMHRNWPYAINLSAVDDALGDDHGAMPIPYAVTAEEAKYPMTGGPASALGGWHLTLNPNSKKKAAAAEFMRATTTDEWQLGMFEVLGNLPPKPELFGSDRAAQVPIMGEYLDTLRVAGENAIPRPVTVVWPQQSGKISNQVNTAYAGDKTAQKAMSDLKAELQQIEESV